LIAVTWAEAPAAHHSQNPSTNARVRLTMSPQSLIVFDRKS
jgi:hypothetical protein